MGFRSRLDSLKSRPSATAVRVSSKRPNRRLQVEALGDRCVPAVISDPAGDFLPTYTGAQTPGLDVVAHQVAYLAGQQRLVFFGRMAGSIAETQQVDRNLFRSTFGKSRGEVGYLWFFDFDGGGDVGGRDNGQFNRQFGRS